MDRDINNDAKIENKDNGNSNYNIIIINNNNDKDNNTQTFFFLMKTLRDTNLTEHETNKIFLQNKT